MLGFRTTREALMQSKYDINIDIFKVDNRLVSVC